MSFKLYSFKFSQCYAASMLKVELQAYGVARTFFRIAGKMRRLAAYFDNPARSSLVDGQNWQFGIP